MPTYQYVCTECGGQLEAVQKFTDDPLTVHDDCGGRLRKVFSPVGIVFKGSGFYKTDSRASASQGSSADSSKSADSSASASSSESSSSDSSSSSSSESSSPKSGGDSSKPTSAYGMTKPASGSKSSPSGEKVA